MFQFPSLYHLIQFFSLYPLISISANILTFFKIICLLIAGKRRGSASMRQQQSQQQTDRAQKLLWQRKHSVPEEVDYHSLQHRESGSSGFLPVGFPGNLGATSGLAGNGSSSRSNSSNASRSRSESVLSTSSSNETLRYNENDVGNSFDSNETVIQPPMEFFDNASTAGNSSTGNESVDLKRFPLGTTYQNQLTQNEDSIQVNIFFITQINYPILKEQILIFPTELMIVLIDLKWISD